MEYAIFKKTAHVMPAPARGTDFIKICLSKASKDMQNVLLPMVFAALGAHCNYSAPPKKAFSKIQ